MSGSSSPPPPSDPPASTPPASSPPSRRSDRPSQRPGGASSLLGTTIGGRYRLDSILGEGGMGSVYAAEHLLMRKRVALKVLHPEMSRNAEVVARFEREAMAAGHIDHPNIAAATDFGQLADGSFFLVLELIVGENLRSVIGRGRLAVPRAVHIGLQLASALSRAHELGVVHRDLKPDNVMLITRGDDLDFVKVLDFGIAKVPVVEAEGGPQSAIPSSPLSAGSPRVLTKVGMIYGTPQYMAPEQALGETVDARADLYALGILLYEMLTGRRPFEHDNLATLLGMQVTAPVPVMSEVAPDAEVPAAIEAVVRRLLAKDPAQRFPSAGELAVALEQAAHVTLPTDRAVAAPIAAPAPSATGSHATAGRIVIDAPIGRVVAIFVGAALVVGTAVALLLSGSHGAPARADRPAQATTGATTAIPSLPAKVPETVPREDPLANAIVAAEAALERQDPQTAITSLVALEPANPNAPDLHRVLERAYAVAHDRAAALQEASAWLALDATASANLPLQADVGEIATHPETCDAAVALLASRMGPPGVDILYDLAYASHQAPPVSRRARAALADPEVRAHAGPAAALLLDLRAATGCEAKRALLPRARTDGDRRALPLLVPMTSGRANACMRRDADLEGAIAAVRTRTGML